MKSCSLPRIQYVTVVGGAQWGKTEILNNLLGQRIHLNPGPIMVVQPTERAAEKWSKTRLMPMVRDTPALSGLIGDKSRDGSNTLLEKSFPGGVLICVGANAPAGLASQPIRDLLMDEIDRIPQDETVGQEGDFEDLAEARTSDFRGRRLIYKCSTPTIMGRSRIENSWKESDQREWHFACPHCGHEQTCDFRQVQFEERAEPVYACRGCGCEITEGDFRRAIMAGKWIAKRPHILDHAGFRVHGLMVRPMAVLVAQFKKAKAKGPGSLQVFINTQLGEWWDPREGDSVLVEGLMARREEWVQGQVPEAVLALVASVDIQDDRLELLIQGIGLGEETWRVCYRQIFGNLATSDPWDTLEELLRQDWGGLRVKACAMDIGGHFTKQAYKFARRAWMKGLVFPVKGATKPQQKLARRSSAKAKLWLVDTVSAKDSILGRLKIEKPGPGYCHFPADLDATYFEMLLSERASRKSGRRAYEKVTADARNEALDLEVYAMAAVEILNPNLEALAKGRETKAAAAAQVVAASSVPSEEPPKPARQRASRGPGRGRMSGW
jgi:phage terminase large subunit GpA-like protein